MADLRPLHDWSGAPAALTVWSPSEETAELVRQAPVSSVPPGFEQEQHLRAFRACEARHEDMARLLITVWEEDGRCDLRAMTQVINAHLRRHDTYHSWFEERDGAILRHAIADPEAIRMEPVSHGTADAANWRRHVKETPSPFQWDCFRFGILQRAGSFTCFAAIDHLHADATVIAFLMEEIHAAYRAVIDGEAPPRRLPAGRHLDYCASQRRRAAAMTLSDPGVAAWVDFLGRNGGRMPPFPLPLGVLEDRCLAEYLHAVILDDAGIAAFEAACEASGARVVGGLLAAAALTERSLAGTSRYSVVTPTTTRRTPEAFRTTGWCVGVVPIDFASGSGGFPDLAASAQHAFDSRLDLAAVPIERVLELAAALPAIRPVATGGVMLSYMDADLPPLSAHIARDWHRADGRVYINQGMAAQVALWFFRTERGLSLTAAFPANATARASMQRYAEAFAAVCREVAGAGLPAL